MKLLQWRFANRFRKALFFSSTCAHSVSWSFFFLQRVYALFVDGVSEGEMVCQGNN